jgi:hypothetical protein
MLAVVGCMLDLFVADMRASAMNAHDEGAIRLAWAQDVSR